MKMTCRMPSQFRLRTSFLVFLVAGSFVAVRTSEAQEWEYLGLPNLNITDIAVQSEDLVYACTYDPTIWGPGSILRTTSGGLTWDTLLSVNSHCLLLHPTNPSVMYSGLGSVEGPWGILKTTDAGESWFHADSGLDIHGEYWIRSMRFDPVHPETLYVGTSDGYRFYKSTNGGESWHAPAGTAYLSPRAIDPISTETVYASDQYGSGGVFKSVDGGETWEETGQLGGGYGYVNGLAIDPVNTSILYAGVGGDYGFFRSTDAGGTWEELTSGLPGSIAGGEMAVNAITREVFGAAFAYNYGAFKSTDLGDTWELLDGLPLYPGPSTVKISLDQTQLYLGYYLLGIYRTTILTTDISNDVEPLPTEVALLQNYPNPFNPVTTISYNLPFNTHVKLIVTDIIGRDMATLVNGKEEAGYKSVRFDARNLATGIYFYRLQAGDFVETRKLVLVR